MFFNFERSFGLEKYLPASRQGAKLGKTQPAFQMIFLSFWAKSG